MTFTCSSISLTMDEKVVERNPPSKKEARQYQGDASLSDQSRTIDRGNKDNDKSIRGT